MVFSSVPLYLDPPNWNQQGSTNIVGDDDTEDVHQLLQPPTTSASVQAPQQAAPGVGMAAVAARPGVSMTERARLAKIPQPEVSLKCPRCDSTNTKFCYFNNYSLTQPRHFCKTCRRYWTRGGALRSIPVGGGCRRNKRSNKPSSSSSSSRSTGPPPVAPSVSTSSSAASGVFRSAPSPFLPPWHHLPDYGFAGIQQPENLGLEHWRIQQIQQFPFLGGLAEPPAQPPVTMGPGLYPFEGELLGGHGEGAVQLHGKIMPTVKMEHSSQATSTSATAMNLPKQFFSMGRNDVQIWPAPGSGDGSGENQGGRWIGSEHLSGFSSSSTGNML